MQGENVIIESESELGPAEILAIVRQTFGPPSMDVEFHLRAPATLSTVDMIYFSSAKIRAYSIGLFECDIANIKTGG